MTLTNIHVATDAAIFTVIDGELHVLLVQMKKKPFTGKWAMPGGRLGDNQTSEAAVREILTTQTGLKNVYLEQLGFFDDPDRDPLGRVASAAYLALVPSEGVELKTTDRYADVRWVPVTKVPALAYDHAAMLAAAVARLRERIGHSAIAWSLLPKEFTLSDLQAAYEAILGEALDKRNFRKKMLALDLLETAGRKTTGGAHRPAELYRFRPRARTSGA